VPFCRECGKEVEADWNSCPYCPQPIATPDMVVNEQVDEPPKTESKQIDTIIITNNQTLWNVVIIAIIIGILFWPHGLLDITLLDRATVDCNEIAFGEYAGTMTQDCVDWRDGGRFILFFTFSFSLIALSIINHPGIKMS
jgi:hypothetical protein